MKCQYFKVADTYIAVTDESPDGFKGVVFIGRGGPSPADVKEQVWTLNQLQKFEKVALADVPDEWLLALGYDKPTPKPAPAQEYEEYEDDFPLLDAEGENLVAFIPYRARRPKSQMAQSVQDDFWGQIGLLVGILLTVLLCGIGKL